MSEILTPREQEIYDLLVAGSTSKEIAYSLNLTYHTVNSHQKNIYVKLGVHSTRELLVKARETPQSTTEDIHISQQLVKTNLPINSFIWDPIYDEGSKANITIINEKIDGKDETCAVVTGNMGHVFGAWAGVTGDKPDIIVLQKLKTMKLFSLKVLGDGNFYTVCFVTPETFKDGDHWQIQFITEKDKISVVNIKIPDDLHRLGISGTKIDFFQSNLDGIKILTENRGPFNLKFWDMNTYE